MPGPRTPETATPPSPAPARTPKEPSRCVRGAGRGTGSGRMAWGGSELGPEIRWVGKAGISGQLSLRQRIRSAWRMLGLRTRRRWNSAWWGLTALAGYIRAEKSGWCRRTQAPRAPCGPLPQPLLLLDSGEATRAPPLPVLHPRGPAAPVAPVCLGTSKCVGSGAQMNERMNGSPTALFRLPPQLTLLCSEIHSFMQAPTRWLLIPELGAYLNGRLGRELSPGRD